MRKSLYRFFFPRTESKKRKKVSLTGNVKLIGDVKIISSKTYLDMFIKPKN